MVSLPAGYVSFQKVSRESEIYILCISLYLYIDIKMYSVAIKKKRFTGYISRRIHPGYNHVGQTIARQPLYIKGTGSPDED